MCLGLANNGIMIISIPNVLSLKGLITKITPLSFHRFFYKYFLGSKIDLSKPSFSLIAALTCLVVS